MLGNAYARGPRDHDVAKRFDERAVALDPDNHIALANISSTLLSTGHEDEGEEYLRRSLAITDRYPNTHYGLGLLSARRGRYPEAFDHATTVLRMAAPNDPIRAPARQLAENAAREYLDGVDQVALFQPYLEKVAWASGRSIEVRPDPALAVAATLEIAEYRGRNRHVLRYRTEAPAYSHVVMHELAKLDFITRARNAGRNTLFVTGPEHHARFLHHIEGALRRLRGLEVHRRHATLVATLLDTRATLIDETIELHEKMLGSLFSRAKRRHEEDFQLAGRAINDKVRLYSRIGRALVEARQQGGDPFAAIEAVLPWERFQESIEEAEKLARPEDFDYLPRIGDGYAQLRRYGCNRAAL
jgi:tetratricopeptide (TPR) repeat protein